MTLRRIIPAGMPSAAAPRASASLFAFGAMSHGAIDSRASTRANHGASSSTEYPGRRSASAQYASVDRRRAERARPVDRRAAADASPLENVDRLVPGLACRRILIQVRVGLGFVHAEVARGAQRSFLDQNHAQAGVAERLGGDPAARAGADNDDVGLEGQVAQQRRRVDHVAVAERVVRGGAKHGVVGSIGHRPMAGGPGYPMAGHACGLPYHAARTSWCKAS